MVTAKVTPWPRTNQALPAQQSDRQTRCERLFFVWCWVATRWLHHAKPGTAGYMVATCAGKQKTPLSFE